MSSKSTPNSQFAQEKLAENSALSLAIPVGVVFAIIWFGIYLIRQNTVSIVGSWHSIGSAILINTLLIASVGFAYGYTKGRTARSPALNKKSLKFIFDCASLSLGYTIVSGVFTLIVIFGLSLAFKDVLMPPFSAALIVSIFAIGAAYLAVRSSVKIRSNDIANMVTVFIGGGVYISMVTAQDPLWWQKNFSSLGTTASGSSLTFNITLVLSGLLLLCLTDHLLEDLHTLKESKQAEAKLSAIKILFVVLSVCLSGVGLFPWNTHPTLHNLSAYGLVVCFSVLILRIHRLIPSLPKTFLANSYTMLFALLACFALWQPLGYFSQTAFELIAFTLTFVWLTLLLRTIAVLDISTHTN